MQAVESDAAEKKEMSFPAKGQKSSQFESLLSKFQPSHPANANTSSNESSTASPSSATATILSPTQDVTEGETSPSPTVLPVPQTDTHKAETSLGYSNFPTVDDLTPVAAASEPLLPQNLQLNNSSAAYEPVASSRPDFSALTIDASNTSSAPVIIETPEDLATSLEMTAAVDLEIPMAAPTSVKMEPQSIGYPKGMDYSSKSPKDKSDQSNEIYTDSIDVGPPVPSHTYAETSYLDDDFVKHVTPDSITRPETGDYMLGKDDPDDEEAVLQKKSGSKSVDIGYSTYAAIETSSTEIDDAYAIEDQPEANLEPDAYLTTSELKPSPMENLSYNNSYGDLDIEDPSSAFELNEDPDELGPTEDEVRGSGLLRLSRPSLHHPGITHVAYGVYKLSTVSEPAPNPTSPGTSDTVAFSPSIAQPYGQYSSPDQNTNIVSEASSDSRQQLQRATSSYGDNQDIPPGSGGLKSSRSSRIKSMFDSATLVTPQAIQQVLDSKGSWNQRFQAIYDAPDSEQKYDALHRLSMDFLGVAETYGKVIIAELSLPDEEKSIKPIKIGGVAGGSKYAVRGLLFKFAVDVPPHFLYGSDEYAQKAAGHELKGLNQWSLSSEGLHFPLMALVRYCGFTLVALSMLPIGNGSLVYGSDDAGRTVHFDDDEIYEKMKKTARNLNLKGHYLLADPSKLIYGPGDIEGHLGDDGLHYVLDFARVYPPAALVQGEIKEKARCLFRLLRPELVSRYSNPLSSDAFTAWGRLGSETHNAEVRLATQYLVDQAIPALAQKLCTLHEPHKFDYTREFHLHGVNVRYMGLVRRVVYSQNGEQNGAAHAGLLREMVARTIKSILSQKWRELIKKYQRITPDRCIQEAIGVLNAFVEPQTTPGSQLFWREKIRTLLNVKFPLALIDSENEMDASTGLPLVDLQQLVFGSEQENKWRFLFSRISDLTGITFGDFMFAHASFPSFGVFTAGDILEIRSSVKQMSLVDFAYVMSKALNALRQLSSSLASRLFALAIERLKEAPEISLLVLRRIIALRAYIVRTLRRMKWVTSLIDLVAEFVDVALTGAQLICAHLPTDLAVDAAVFLHEIHANSRTGHDKIIKYLERAIVSDPSNVKPYVEVTKIQAFTSRPDLTEEVRVWIDKTVSVAPDDALVRLQLGLLILTLYNAFSPRYHPANGITAREEVLNHWRIVRDTHPSLFRAIDLHHFTHRTDIEPHQGTSSRYLNNMRSRNFIALMSVAQELDCPELNETIKEAIRLDFNIIYLSSCEYTPWTLDTLNFLASMGPFPHLSSILLGTGPSPWDPACEPAFARFVGNHPNIVEIEIAASAEFKGEFLSELNPTLLNRIDLGGAAVTEAHLDAFVDKLVAQNTASPLVTLIVPPTIGAECLGKILLKLSQAGVSLHHLRCACWDENLAAAIITHANTLTLLSLAGASELVMSSIQELLPQLPKLLLFDGNGSSLQDDNVLTFASTKPSHPCLEILISATGTQYYFTGATSKTMRFSSAYVKPTTFSLSLVLSEWRAFDLLKYTKSRETMDGMGSFIPVYTCEKSMSGPSPQTFSIFGRNNSSPARSGTNIVVMSTHIYWNIGHTRVSELRLPQNLITHGQLQYLENGRLKTIMPKAMIAHVLRLTLPSVDQNEALILLTTTGGAANVTLKPLQPITFWAFSALSYIRALPI